MAIHTTVGRIPSIAPCKVSSTADDMTGNPPEMTAARRSPARLPAKSQTALRLYVQILVAIGGLVLVRSIAALPHVPHPLEWMAFAFFALATGSFTIRIASIEARMTASDTFYITSALLFGPGPATVALAIDSILMVRGRGNTWTRLAFNAVAPALSMWVAAHVFFLLARVPPLSEGHPPAAALIIPLFCLTVIYFGLNSGLTAIAVGLEAQQSPIDHLAEALSLAVARLSGGGVGGILSRAADSADEPQRRGGDPAGGGRLPPDVACDVRAPRGRATVTSLRWIGSTCPRSKRSRWPSMRKTT